MTPTDKLKQEAYEVKDEAKAFLMKLHKQYPHGRFAFTCELQSEAGIAPVTESAGVTLMPTFCRMLTAAASEQLAFIEEDLKKKEAKGRN